MSVFGSQVPFAEPYWYDERFKSPYYNESHRKFRAKIREFTEKEIYPYVGEWDEKGDYPRELHEKAYKAGVLSPTWPKEYGGTPPENFDAFHDLIWIDELTRGGSGGVLASCFFIPTMALPPVLNFGSDEMKERVCRPVIEGKKVIALAVTEPYGGSDVASIRTTAVKDGDYYIVNGEKKFITAGLKADYFTTAVRTGGPGMGGISVLLLEKGMPGLAVRRMKTQGWWSSGTTYVTFKDVKVPAKNLIGAENAGFLIIMHNFNHERFVAVVGGARGARGMLHEAITYARDRKTFGKRLIDHQVIRHKIADMARETETLHALCELITYQMKTNVSPQRLGALMSLAKVHATKVFEYCAREASQILGGASYLREGKGALVERAYREVRVAAIGGGSEEILLDLAMRLAKL